MQKSIVIRLVFGIVLVLSGLFYPWWVILWVAIIGALLFDTYYEALIAGVVLDLLYASPAAYIFDIPLLFTVGGIMVFGLNVFSKKYLRAV